MRVLKEEVKLIDARKFVCVTEIPHTRLNLEKPRSSIRIVIALSLDEAELVTRSQYPTILAPLVCP
ncbi:MAG: hypothetical protein CL946_03990 [Ectothiorhodospiraceae bacterium]|nr:hypothetical protein [Ectothiorhodospiraceae bacterium]